MQISDADRNPPPPAGDQIITLQRPTIARGLPATGRSEPGELGGACARIVSGLRRAGYSDVVATTQARKFAERIARLELDRDYEASQRAVAAIMGASR